MPTGHFFHAEDALIEILELAEKRKPELSFARLHASLAQLLLAKGSIDEAREQVEHLVALATGAGKEQGQKVLEALVTGDAETAAQLLAKLSG